jgi:signal transduction histidine kinase
VDGDPTRLAQVVGNLVHNACKFTPKGGRVHVALRREGPDAVFSVKDSGVGIPPDKLASIFGMFAQLENGGVHGQSGLGLGLHLAKNLVELHGGTLTAKSEGTGQGSEFVLRMPAVD